jgi:hypothetical protein
MAQLPLDEFWAPQIEPTEIYSPQPDVNSYMFAVPPSIVLEIYTRPSHTIGVRYSAWVAWRDADGNVRSHGWTHLEPAPLVTDTIEEAKRNIEAKALTTGLVLSNEWQLTRLCS